MSCSFPCSVPPVLSKFNGVSALLNGTGVLMFSVNQNATPSVAEGDVTVQLNGTAQANDRQTIKIENYTISVSISQLEVGDSGNYTIMVATDAGEDATWAYLTVEG